MKVEMVQLESYNNFRYSEATYIVAGKGWRATLQRKLLQLVRKLGASDQLPHVEYKRVIVDTTDIVNACREQIYHIYKQTGKLPSQIIVGRKEYYELGASMTTNFMLHSGESIRFLENSQVRRLSLDGVPVTVTPYIEGVVVIP